MSSLSRFGGEKLALVLAWVLSIFGLSVSLTNVELNAQTAVNDKRLMVELFAKEPDVVTPTGIAIDRRGRVFVAESHTHFRPDNYDGPTTDRILILEDTNGDGRMDKRSIFHEGFTFIMDIEFAHDDSLYVATRMDIHRMQDSDGDNRADKVEPIVRMETEGDYPHNGLSGLAFDLRGGLNFGLGENLGKSYALIGSDGSRFEGGGEGGSTYCVEADGSKLRRVTTGWWNPFGMCVDAFGRIYGTDNDPDASPPCRLIQCVPGGDYGYEFRYGRTGLHPLTTWNGTLPGTLPMISGTGEAPCAVIAYESDALPAEYRGRLLVASWADHSVEQYLVTQSDAGLVQAKRMPFVHGPDEFRPVGLDVAPDGTIYVSDWVSSSYTLHKLGRIWRIRPQEMRPKFRPTEPLQAMKSMDRATREQAARELADSTEGLGVLRRLAVAPVDVRVRATALQALASKQDKVFDWRAIAQNDADTTIRVLAIRGMPLQNENVNLLLASHLPAAAQAELIRNLNPSRYGPKLVEWNSTKDELVRQAVVDSFAKWNRDASKEFYTFAKVEPLLSILSWRSHPQSRQKISAEQLSEFLLVPNPEVQIAAIKWIADDMRKDCRDSLSTFLENSMLDSRLFLAVMAAIDRLDGKPPTDRPSSEILVQRLKDPKTSDALREVMLRLIDPLSPKVRFEDLESLTRQSEGVALEAVRTLAQHPDDRVREFLKDTATNSNVPVNIRGAAIAGLAPFAEQYSETLLALAQSSDIALANESLRSLVGVKLSDTAMDGLTNSASQRPQLTETVQRITQGAPGDRPPAMDIAGWVRLVNQPGDAAAGERVFFGNKVGTCSRCHQYGGRGYSVGPDLSRIHERFKIGTADRSWLLETVLVPGKQMAPQYTPWVIQLKDGRTMTGLPRRKGGDYEAYLGNDGKEFTLKLNEIESHEESSVSIMPKDLLLQLTTQEIADLLAFLER